MRPGTALTPDSITPQAGFDGTLAPGAATSWTVAHTMSQADIDAGGIRNTATLAGTTPAGLPVSDISDDGVRDARLGDTTSDPDRTGAVTGRIDRPILAKTERIGARRAVRRPPVRS